MSDEQDKKAEPVAIDGEKEPIGEMVDRAERKAAKEKAKKLAKKKEPDELDLALRQGRLAEVQKAKRKRMIKVGALLAGLAFFGWAGNLLFSPFKVGKTYGICKVFLETEVQFPQYLRFTGAKKIENSIRVEYRRVDAFGEHRMETARCYFKRDETTGRTMVDKITIDRREVDPRKVERFNVVLPVVLQNLPDLTFPPPLEGNSLRGLKFDADSLRKKIF